MYQLLLLCLLLFTSQKLLANEVVVPEPLKPWQAWAMYDYKVNNCPVVYQQPGTQRICAWPSPLTLSLSEHSGQFSQSWQLWEDGWIYLPGDRNSWPQQIMANGQAQAVGEDNQRPRIWLKKGQYQIKGQWSWSQLPESLMLATGTAAVTLSIEQQAIVFPNIQFEDQDNARLMLHDKRQINQNALENTHSVEVFRRIVDDMPMKLTTRIVLNISGEAREISIPALLLENSTPLTVNSDVPLKLEPSGALRVQARPGQWVIEITSRMAGDITELSLPANQANEVWVFEARPALRQVEISGVNQIDPRQTRLPEDWQSLPSYQVNTGQKILLKVQRRGNPSPAANNLNLKRKVWLDFDGSGYTIQDQIDGTMNQDWRLQMSSPYLLTRANLNGQDQLITHLNEAKQSGIEVRDKHLNMNAESRIEQGSMSNLGWQHEFNSVSGELNLPPGYRLLHISGVDKVSHSWLQNWTLLDIFLTLIITLTIYRLWGIPAALVAAALLLLTWHEPDAPKWIWLNIIAAVALLRVLPDGKIKQKINLYRWLSMAALLLIFLAFAVNTVREGLYPQLEYNTMLYTSKLSQQERSKNDEYQDAVVSSKMESIEEALVPNALAPEGRIYSAPANLQQNIDTQSLSKQQTGLGLPEWRWNQAHFSWSGPVGAEQSIKLWLLSPSLSLIWNILSVLLMAGLMLIIADLLPRLKPTKVASNISHMVLMCCVALFCASNSNTSWANSDPRLIEQTLAEQTLPDKSLLDELKRRLIAAQEKAPECAPNCALSPKAHLSIQNDQLRLDMELHAQAELAIPVPFISESWQAQELSLDGKAVSTIRLHQKQALLLLTPGVHQLTLIGRLPAQASLRLPLPLAPQQLTSDVDGWQIQGVTDGKVAGDLQLIRQQKLSANTNDTQTNNSQTLPPFIIVKRHIHLGLEWQVETQLQRIGDINNTVELEIPLLTGESVLSENITVKNSLVQATLAAGQSQLSWTSKLDISNQISLQAPKTDLWLERWSVSPSSLWRIRYQGIPEVLIEESASWTPEWWPWQGEQLNIQVSRPDGIDGSTLTIDESTLSIEPGSRISSATYSFKLRTSQGGQQIIPLPIGAKLQKLWINDIEQAIQPELRNIPLNLTPGSHQIKMNWQLEQGINTLYHTPIFNTHIPSANQSIQLTAPENRWILFAGGPSFGPAVLFWGVLLVILMVSIALARSNYTPLKTSQWLLLGVGLSQLPIALACIVASWFFVLAWRSKHTLNDAARFNSVQIGIVLLSLISSALLLSAVWQGLLGAPDMQITGNGSWANNLNWYQDRSDGSQASAWVLSVPLFIYRLLMLLWSLWLAFSVLKWVQWGWQAFSKDSLWKKLPERAKPTFNKPTEKHNVRGTEKITKDNP